MPRINRLAATAALAAVLVTAAVPAVAADLPRSHSPSWGPASAQAYDGDANSAENHRWRRHRHGGGIDGGDVLAGVLILGGIAAVAGAIENNKRDDDYRDYPPPPQPQGRYDYRDTGSQGTSSSTGLDRAADICVDAIERTSDPVGSVDSVRRGPSGWDVDGTLQNGAPFACKIGNNGQIEDVRIDNAYSGAAYGSDQPSYDDEPAYDGTGEDNRPYYDEQSSADGQYDDETYARLRAQRDGQGG
jgi:hypothetical protein